MDYTPRHARVLATRHRYHQTFPHGKKCFHPRGSGKDGRTGGLAKIEFRIFDKTR